MGLVPPVCSESPSRIPVFPEATVTGTVGGGLKARALDAGGNYRTIGARASIVIDKLLKRVAPEHGFVLGQQVVDKLL